MEKEFPSPKYTGTSGEENDSEDPSDLEVELHEDPQRKERALRMYEAQMRIKSSRCPKGYFICPEVTCQYFSNRKEKISLYVTKQHEFSDHAEQAKKEIQNYMKEKEEKKKENEEDKDRKRAQKRKADEKKDQENLQKFMILMEREKEEKKLKRHWTRLRKLRKKTG